MQGDYPFFRTPRCFTRLTIVCTFASICSAESLPRQADLFGAVCAAQCHSLSVYPRSSLPKVSRNCCEFRYGGISGVADVARLPIYCACVRQDLGTLASSATGVTLALVPPPRITQPGTARRTAYGRFFMRPSQRFLKQRPRLAD